MPFRTHCRAARPCVRPTSPLSPARCAAAGRVGAPPRGPLGGLGAPRPAPRIPGPGGERGGRPARAAGCALAGPERRELGEEPGPAAAALPTPWPFVPPLCPSPSGSRASPRRCPGKVCVPGPSGAVETQPLRGGVGGGSRALASPRRKRLPRAICNRPQLVSARRPRAGGRASAWGRGGDPRPRTLAARQRRARSNQSSCHLSPPGTG